MKIKELIKLLNEFSPDMEIYFASDEEGNILHPIPAINETNIAGAENKKGEVTSEEEKNVVVVYPQNSDGDIN